MDPNDPPYSRVNSPARQKRRAMKDMELRNQKSVTSRTNLRDPSLGQPPQRADTLRQRRRTEARKTTEIPDRFRSSKKVTERDNQSVKFDHNMLRKWSLEVQSESSVSSLSNESHSPQASGVGDDLKVKWDQEKETHKLKILATLLPDEILRDPITRKPRPYDVALLFPDVSGFTELCQKYDKTGKGGPSRLTEVLNGYIGSMIKIVLSRNGDVCKFGGDAFLCAWKVTEKMNMSDIVNLAIESAVDIQKNCGEHTTDVGVKLRVKMAVSAGRAFFSIIGTTASRFFVIVGPPVLEVRDGEQLCRAGDIIVTPSAWKHVSNYMLYSFTYHTDGKHIKVHDFGPLWKSVQGELQERGVQFDNTRFFLKGYEFPFKIQNVRPFILPPVMRSIDLSRSLDHLTEMRQVAIVFFNITAKFSIMTAEEIIKLSNEVFRVVATIVDKAGGAVNKLTLFDKDMALLTVFGLKGFKHELASLVALQCASACLAQLSQLKLESASAGVTTGMAYCGVIGHPLRKEYTMMGHAVNMAARLMCAYRSIVSTDRNTFLHSKLESSHFEVLEHEPLKGIQSTEPVYKFHLNPQRTASTINREDYPILGREKQIEMFETFLKNGLASTGRVNIMIIFGKARIGKSRLVATLIKITEQRNAVQTDPNSRLNRIKPVHVEINVISLAEDMSRSAYSVIKMIFLPILGLVDSSTTEERADKILSKLVETRAVSYLAAFNVIFNVNFDLTPQYLALNHADQHRVRMFLLYDLYSKCFTRTQKWLMVIEDAEYVDDESWNFIVHCSTESSSKALYLLTVGQRKALSPTATDSLERIRAERITLGEIDKWYYSGLACQILSVRAIPVELENLLQSYKSSGNPGWLESFLISMIQSGSIYVTQVATDKMKSMGLVFPPEAMLRTTMSKKSGLQTSTWIDYLETFESLNSSGEKSVRVCLLGPNFRVGNENETELTMDVMFIKMMDMLKPLEQMILKAASVLGNNIQRSALKFLIEKDSHIEERQLSKAIKNLFEIKILTCGKGNALEANLMVSRRMVLDTSIRKEVVCECKSLEIPAECRDLPKYANCGFMQFKNQTFKDTVYNLLLDDQKKKFHSSCIEFLRKTTTRCKSCDGVPFHDILGRDVNGENVLYAYPTDLENQEQESCWESRAKPQWPTACRAEVASLWGPRWSPIAEKLWQSKGHKTPELPVGEGGRINATLLRQAMELGCIQSPMHGVRSTRLNPKFHLQIRRKFSLKDALGNDFKEDITKQEKDQGIFILDKGDCQCAKILSSVYSVLLDHATGSGRKDIKMEVLLEYASVSLTSYNIPLTMQILNDALALANEMKEERVSLEFCTPFIYAKIYTLMGAAKLSLGRLDESLDHLQMSLAFMNQKLPRSRLKMRIINQRTSMKLKTMTEIFPEKYIGAASEEEASTLDLLSECLALISTVQIFLRNWLLAKLAALWALTTALESNRNFYGLCISYTCMIEVAFENREFDNSAKLEMSGIRACSECIHKITEVYEWEAVSRLYRVIYHARHIRAEIEDAVHIGYQSVRIASVIRSTSLKLETIPGLIFALVQLDRLSEAVVLIKELEFMSHLDSDKSSKFWYYTICMNFQLYTGFTIVPYEVCESFLKSDDERSLFRDPDAKIRLYTSLWLWCIRHNEGELIKSYAKILKTLDEERDKETPSSVFARLQKLEGYLIFLVHKIDAKSIHSINAAYLEIHNLMSKLKKDIKIVKVLRPRYQVLLSYYRQIRYRDESYHRLLNQAQSQAEKMKDRNLAQWIVHLRMVQFKVYSKAALKTERRNATFKRPPHLMLDDFGRETPFAFVPMTNDAVEIATVRSNN